MEADNLLKRAELILDYEFNDREILIQALTAAHSIGNDAGRIRFENNKRLAALGEVVLKLILVEIWLRRNETLGISVRWNLGMKAEERQGTLQDLQIRNLSNQALATIATQSGIESCISRSDRQQYLTESAPATLHTAVKALVGATWIDSGRDHEKTRRAIENLR